MKHKLTNTWLHALVAFVAALVTWLALVVAHLIDPTAVLHLGGLAGFIFFGATVMFEMNQKVKYIIDSIVDVVVANATYLLTLWILGVI